MYKYFKLYSLIINVNNLNKKPIYCKSVNSSYCLMCTDFNI